jgi:hypothetical protein
MHVDNDDPGMLAVLVQKPIDATERVIDMVRHENTPLQINDQSPQPVCPLPLTPPPTGGAFRKIGGSNQVGMILQIGVDLLFPPNVIAAGEHVNARAEKFAGALDVDAHAAGGILRVCDDKVDLLLLTQAWHKFSYRPAARATHDVAQNQYPHHSIVSCFYSNGYK